MGISDLLNTVKKKSSHIVLKISYMPEACKCDKEAAGQIFENAKSLITAAKDSIVCVLVDVPAFLTYRNYGFEALIKTTKFAKKNKIFTVWDMKAGYYAPYLRENVGDVIHKGSPDAITVSPYLTDDDIQRYIFDVNEYNKSIFMYIQKDEDIERVNDFAAQTLGASKYSNFGCILPSGDDIYEKRNKLPISYIILKDYTYAEVEEAFDTYGFGTLVLSKKADISHDPKEEAERIRKIVNNLIRKNRFYL